jgi:alpha-tubulin suppressor-like RCC1 family protein
VAAGIDFSLGLSKDGKVWSWGNPQYGQLGHGSDEQYIGKGNKVIFEPQLPKLISKFEGKRITDIQCGSNHSLALDNTGAIYVWGCAGYGRLGLNETPPRDVMVPKEVAGFKNRNNYVKKIACGPTCCMVTDSRDSLYLWGKWKNSGDGGQGTPWLYPRHFDGLSGWKIDDIACGGVSLFVISEKSTISWGIILFRIHF